MFLSWFSVEKSSHELLKFFRNVINDCLKKRAWPKSWSKKSRINIYFALLFEIEVQGKSLLSVSIQIIWEHTVDKAKSSIWFISNAVLVNIWLIKKKIEKSGYLELFLALGSSEWGQCFIRLLLTTDNWYILAISSSFPLRSNLSFLLIYLCMVDYDHRIEKWMIATK